MIRRAPILTIVIAVATCTILSPPQTLATWYATGNVICATEGERTDLAMISAPLNGAYCAWTDLRGDNSQVYLQHVDVDGNNVLQENGLPISPLLDDAEDPHLIPDSASGLFVAWHRGHYGHFWVMRVSSDGQMLWPEPVAVRPAGTEARWLRAVADDAGGTILAWQDRSHEDSLGVFAQHLDADGARLWGDNGLRICNYPGDPEMTADGNGGAFIVWADSRATQASIFMQRVAGVGTLFWPVDGLQVTGSSSTQAYPEVVSDGDGGVIVAWLDIYITDHDIYARRYAGNGSSVWPARLVVDDDGWYDFDLRADVAGGAILAWPSGDPNRVLRAQRLDVAGQPMWSAEGAVVADAPGTVALPDMIATWNGGAILAWQDRRNGGCQGIYAQRLAPDGTSEWQEDGVVVTDRDLHQLYPQVIPGGPYDALVMWRDPDDAGDILYLTYLAAWTNGPVEECSLTSTDVPDLNPAGLQLASHPNPFNPRTEINFTLPRAGQARLIVYDALGRKVAMLVDSSLPAGKNRAVWDGRNASGAAMPAGIYLVRLQQGDAVETRIIALIR